ncbi:MAG: hypothetical protein HQ557_20020 [Bacteroidetes bacterium]|nr:hypothetical protein [Bacteroidota bacterium]
MARIRSALEIALERTESVAGDPEKIRNSELIKTGKRLMGTFLFNHDSTVESLEEKLNSIPDTDKTLVREHMIETLLLNISLPQDELYVMSLGKLKSAAELLAPATEAAEATEEASPESNPTTQLFIQLDQLYLKYLQSREQLLDMAKQQYAPHLKQKEEQLSRQMGKQVNLQPEQDPDFIKFLEANYQRLEDNFQEAIQGLRDQLRTLLG